MMLSMTVRAEARAALIRGAQTPRGMMSYTDVCARLSEHVEPQDPRLWSMLGDISTEEAASGRPLLSAIVVHKTGDMKPGHGFHGMARRAGRVGDDDSIWLRELEAVWRYWREPSCKLFSSPT